MKYTKGPWFYDMGLNVTNGKEYPEAVDICHVYIEDLTDSECMEIAESEARLISCAPEMLESLIEVYKTGSNTFNGLTWKVIESLIEKATGLKIDEVIKCQ